MSHDGTHVYFAATGELAPGGQQGVPNIYLWQQGEGIQHVATLSSSTPPGIDRYLDIAVWNDGLIGSLANANPARGARTTPDGEHLLFESYGRLTAFDNAGHQQIYLFDANNGRVTCVSCSHRTSSSAGDASFSIVLDTADLSHGNSRVGDATHFIPRNLSQDGSRAFFDTEEPLLSSDSNGISDVYEWEDGHLYLISSGQSGRDSTFFGASESGDDVFFISGESLVRSDKDPLLDVYDARVGGFKEPAPIPDCVADECQGTPKAPPFFTDPGTSTFKGTGNPTAGKNKHWKHKHKKRHRKHTGKQSGQHHGRHAR